MLDSPGAYLRSANLSYSWLLCCIFLPVILLPVGVGFRAYQRACYYYAFCSYVLSATICGLFAKSPASCRLQASSGHMRRLLQNIGPSKIRSATWLENYSSNLRKFYGSSPVHAPHPLAL